jgi:fucose 4-O-acetylase-like acetyltransferase
MKDAARSRWADRAKGIGIALVVYGHVARGLIAAGLLAGPTVLLVDSVIYAFHMPLFFFLSGVFFRGSLAGRGPGCLLASKVDRLLYPYVIWTLIQVGVVSWARQWVNHPGDGLSLFGLALAPIAQFWFLWALFGVFLWSTVVMALGGGGRYAVVLGVLCSLGAYLAVAYGSVPAPWHHVAGFLIYFWVGVWVGPRMALVGTAPGLPTVLLALAAAACAQWAFHAQGLTYSSYGMAALALALVCILATVLVCVMAGRGKAWAVVDRLGASSMDIYLLHILAGSGTRILLHRGLGITDPVVHLVAGCLVGLTLPLLAARGLRSIGAGWLFAPPAWASLSRWWPQRRVPRGAA